MHHSFVYKEQLRTRAIIRGLDYVFRLCIATNSSADMSNGDAETPENFDLFGHDAVQCMYDAAVCSSGQIRARVLMYVEALGHKWHRRRDGRGNKGRLNTATYTV
jgi:hypothetical protein